MSKIHASLPSSLSFTLLAYSSASLDTISRSTKYPFPVMYSLTNSAHSFGTVFHSPRLFASPATRHAPHRRSTSSSTSATPACSTISGRGNTRCWCALGESESETENKKRENRKRNRSRTENLIGIAMAEKFCMEDERKRMRKRKGEKNKEGKWSGKKTWRSIYMFICVRGTVTCAEKLNDVTWEVFHWVGKWRSFGIFRQFGTKKTWMGWWVRGWTVDRGRHGKS